MVKRVLGKNKKAHHDYEISKEYEAGMALRGWEVKSIKAGDFSLKESYIDIKNSEPWVHGMHVSPWKFASTPEGVNERRVRKLLLQKREIDRLTGQKQQRGFSIIPLDIHLVRGRIKMQIALARGRKKYDKRQAIKERETKKEIDRDLKQAGY